MQRSCPPKKRATTTIARRIGARRAVRRSVVPLQINRLSPSREQRNNNNNKTQSELRRRLDGESRTAPIDLRGRLGPSAGAANRRGRLVEWRKSEQRAVELLDGLCAGMAANYRLVDGGDGGGDAHKSAVWRKYRGEGREEGVAAPPTSGPGVAAHEAQQKQLAAACGLLLEEVEEELVAALREDGGGGEEGEGEEGEEEVGASKLDVSTTLCRKLTRRCEGKEQQQEQEKEKEEAKDNDDDDDTNKGRGGEL